MARATFVLRAGQLVERHLAPPPPAAGRRLGRAPAIRTDGMDAMRSMADGKLYDSRSAYYASVKAAGCEIVGDDRSGFSRPPAHAEVSTDDIRRAVADLEGGRAEPVRPGPVSLGGWD